MSRHRPRPGLRLGTARLWLALRFRLGSGWLWAQQPRRLRVRAALPLPECVRRRWWRQRWRSQRRTESTAGPAPSLPPPPSPSLLARPPASLPPPCPLPRPTRPGGGARDRSGPAGRGPQHRSPKPGPLWLSLPYPRPVYTDRPPPWLFSLHLSHPCPNLGPLPNSFPNLTQTPVPYPAPLGSGGTGNVSPGAFFSGHLLLLIDPPSSRPDPQITPNGPPFSLRSGEVHPSPSGRSRRAVSVGGRSKSWGWGYGGDRARERVTGPGGLL